MHPPALLHGQLGWDRHARPPDDRQLARIRRTAWEKQEGRTFGARPAARDDLPTGPAAAPTITTPRHAHDEAVGALLHPLVLPLSTSAAAHWYGVVGRRVIGKRQPDTLGWRRRRRHELSPGVGAFVHADGVLTGPSRGSLTSIWTLIRMLGAPCRPARYVVCHPRQEVVHQLVLVRKP